VVWFGESLPEDALANAREAAGHCDVFLSIGTSSVVFPAAGLIDEALSTRALVIEINPQATPYSSRVHAVLAGPAGLWVPKMVEAAWGR
jgi:NAD-dependent deacetylase